MRVNFKVYPKKIHVYKKTHEWVYVWSTNAYRTCRDAIESAKTLYPNDVFKANFAKD